MKNDSNNRREQLSNLMREAWKIWRFSDMPVTFSEALKKAWAMVKGAGRTAAQAARQFLAAAQACKSLTAEMNLVSQFDGFAAKVAATVAGNRKMSEKQAEIIGQHMINNGLSF